MGDFMDGAPVNVDIDVVKQYESTIASLRDEIAMIKKTHVPMLLSFQGTIDAPPVSKEQMYGQSCQNDAVTVNHWSKIWLDHTKINASKFDIMNNTVMLDYGKYAYRPVICAGSGPSLKKNAHLLTTKPDEIGLVSCLHNFAYFIDLGIKCDGYVNLDAGDITIPEMSQGGKHPADYYWNATKDCTLIATPVSKPELLDRWQGRILFFKAPVPDMAYMIEEQKVCPLEVYFNVGGNALGAAYYHARAILGGTPIVFVGADFSFDYTRKFHSWESPYDKQFSGVTPCTDVFGNRVYSWPSYVNFAQWFIHQSMGGNGNNPAMFINCTEGGILGAFPNGNLASIKQMALIDFLAIYTHHKMTPDLVKGDPTKPKLLF
jgi:hypothetical protein